MIMRRAKYLLVVFIGTLVYVFLSLTVGQNSITCYRQLEDQKRIVSKQKTEIQNINSELILELTALKSDKAVIAAYARKLDYVGDGEKLIKINGLKPSESTLYETGSVVRHKEPDYVSERLCKIAAICSAILVFVLLLLSDSKKTKFTRSRNNVINGIPVYEVCQI